MNTAFIPGPLALTVSHDNISKRLCSLSITFCFSPWAFRHSFLQRDTTHLTPTTLPPPAATQKQRRTCQIFANTIENATTPIDLDHFGKLLCCHWSNKDQAMENPPFWAHVRVFARKLPKSVLGDHAYYVENYYDYNMKRPYRSVIYKTIPYQGSKTVIEVEVYKPKEPEKFYEGGKTPAILDVMIRDDLEKSDPCCNSLVYWDESKMEYQGNLKPGKGCKVFRNGKESYLKNEYTLSEDRHTSWDQGFDLDTDEKLWGAAAGPFDFKKVEQF